MRQLAAFKAKVTASEARSGDESVLAVDCNRLVEAEQLAFIVSDAKGRVTRTGGDFDDFSAIGKADEIIGENVFELISRLDLRDAADRPLVEGNDAAATVRELMASGDRRRLSAIASLSDDRRIALNSVFTEEGEVMTTLKDVTDIVQDREMLEIAMRAASAGYWRYELSTNKFSYSDSVLARLTDKEVARMQSHGLFTIVHKDDLPRLSQVWQDVLNGVGVFDFRYRVQTEKEGTMWQRSIGRLHKDKSGTLRSATAFVMDITADVEAQDELRRAQEMAQEKQDFLARMSHEIRTPLNAIIGMADSLSDEPMTAEVRDVISDIEASAENLHELLNRTLDHAKLADGAVMPDYEEGDLRDPVEACVRLWRSRIESKGLKFQTVVAPDVPAKMDIDPYRVQQCISNLLSNAVKFTETGKIVLAARMAEYKGAPHVAVIVQDTGIGMTKDQTRGIFNAFAQADESITRRFGGTGLGLSISRQLATLMHGELQVRSELGKGSSFVLLLPIKQPKSAIVDAGPVTSGAPSTSSMGAELVESKPTETRRPFEGLSVLCVEDNQVNQKVVERLIGSRVSQLHFAANGKEGLAILNTVHIDVVLMDIHMPVMDGIEATLEIRKSDKPYANVIIIALTADPDYQQMRICRNIGMDDTIAKPVRREDILEAFNRTLGRLSETHGVRVALA